VTIFGVDISDFQRGLTMSTVKANGYSFVIARALSFPNGMMVEDPSYETFRDQSRVEGLLFGAYVLFHPSRTPAAQAGLLADKIGDNSISVMIDWEPDGFPPSIAYAEACYDACTALGLRVTLLYAPYWYWVQQGFPSLTGRPWVGVNSSYGSNPAGYGSVVYPGDDSAGWSSYGGLPVTILQFGSRVQLSGWLGNVDANAYRGTLDQLHAERLFTDWSTAQPTPLDPATEEVPSDMYLIIRQANGAAYLLCGAAVAYGLHTAADVTALNLAGIPVANVDSTLVTRMLAGRTVHP